MRSCTIVPPQPMNPFSTSPGQGKPARWTFRWTKLYGLTSWPPPPSLPTPPPKGEVFLVRGISPLSGLGRPPTYFKLNSAPKALFRRTLLVRVGLLST